MTPHVLVVGAGLSGMVVAERVANELGKRVLVIDKRDHIGGNCHDYVDGQTGIRVSKYGCHIFHTNDAEVFDYVRRFSEWVRYDHQVVARVPDVGLVQLPVNLSTINAVCGQNLTCEEEAVEFLRDRVRVQVAGPPTNGEESCLSRFPPEIYEAIFRPYTKKQWQREPADLHASVLDRIPLRLDWDPRYFTDRYQALPKHGFTRMFEAMVESCNGLVEVRLGTDYFDAAEKEGLGAPVVVFTGPIDRYFADKGLEPLEYRSLRFDLQRHLGQSGYVQTHSVVNYPSESVPFTRVVEYKHLFPESRGSPHSVTVAEYPADEGEPYYPVVNAKNLEAYAKYQELARKAEVEDRVFFVGRLANHKYFNMDQAIRNALDFFESNKHRIVHAKVRPERA